MYLSTYGTRCKQRSAECQLMYNRHHMYTVVYTLEVFNMSQAWMLTIPRNVPKRALKVMLEKNDVKSWTIGFEVGKDGYRHYQVRLVSSNDGFFEWCKAHIPTAHVKKAVQESGNYERKSGNFVSSEDTNSIRSVRFGNPTKLQKKILQEVRSQNDRQIDVYLDKQGNHGKSWLTVHLWERGEALVVPRSVGTARQLSAFICSAYRGQAYIIIDIPRAGKIDTALYETMEEIKDGLVFDERYTGKCRNIRGVKLIVFTNKALDTKYLSHDRWRLHGINKEEA
nr:MAG: replication associated protein [Smacoviridae sp.]